jgi:hypothetical protein
MRRFVLASILALPLPAQAQLADQQQQRAARDMALSGYINVTESLRFWQRSRPQFGALPVSPACQSNVNRLLQGVELPAGMTARYLSEKPLNPANLLPQADTEWVKNLANRSTGATGAGDWKVLNTPQSGYAHVVPLRMEQTCVQCHGMTPHIEPNIRLLTGALGRPPQAPNLMPGDVAGYLVLDIPPAALGRYRVVDNTQVIPVPAREYNIYLTATQEAILAPAAQAATAWQTVFKRLPAASNPLKETLYIRQALAQALAGDVRGGTDAMLKARRIGLQPGHWYALPRLENSQPTLPINTCLQCHTAGDLKNMTPVKVIAHGR